MMVIITILVLCIYGKGDFNSIYLSICHVPSGVTQQRTLETVQQLDMKLLYMAGKLQHGLEGVMALGSAHAYRLSEYNVP